MQIILRNIKIVRPAAQTPHHRLWISNLDLVAPCVHSPKVYFYRPNGLTGFFNASKLRLTLAQALVTFYPLAGRLARNEDGRIEIDCNGEGVQLVEAESTDAALEDFRDFAPTTDLRRLIPTVSDTDDDVSKHPLLVIQLTYFKCGGVSLGVGMHHYVVDGFSSAHFINSWSDLARGASITVKPFIDRTVIRARDPPLPLFSHVEYQPMPNSVASAVPCYFQQTSPLLSQASVRMFHLTQYHLQALRKKEAPLSRHLSTFSLTAAHIWRCMCLACNLSHNDVTVMYTAADGRKRISPPLPEGYFGNVIFTAAPVCTTAEVIAGAAGKIQDAILRMDDEYCRSALDYLEVTPDLGMLARGPNMFKSNIGLTSWLNLPVYDADFGWGRPAFMGPGWIAFEGLAFLLCSPTKDASMMLAISLQAKHMEVFQNLIFDI